MAQETNYDILIKKLKEKYDLNESLINNINMSVRLNIFKHIMKY